MFGIEEVFVLKMESELFSATSVNFCKFYTVLRKKKRCRNLKKDALDRTVWRTRFGIGCELVRKADYVIIIIIIIFIIIIIIIIINIINHPRPKLHSTSACSHNSTGLTDQALLIHCAATYCLTVRYVSSIAAFFYIQGC